jgi:hypothetical protein
MDAYSKVQGMIDGDKTKMVASLDQIDALMQKYGKQASCVDYESILHSLVQVILSALLLQTRAVDGSDAQSTDTRS